jgi:hypothetical protein
MVSLVSVFIAVIRISGLLVLGASVSVVVIAPIALGGQHPADPFAAYADLLLAEPPHDFARRGFECQAGTAPTFAWDCMAKPVDGKFSEIGITISYHDGHQRVLSFRPRQHTVLIGDLMLLWGEADIRVERDYTYFNWSDVQARAIIPTHGRRYSHFQPVSYIAMTFLLA